MTSLKEFLKGTRSSSTEIVIAGRESRELVEFDAAKKSILDLLQHETDFEARDAEEFSGKIAKALSSDEVIDEISDLLGSPGATESKSDFVERAKKVMTIVLKSKVGIS